MSIDDLRRRLATPEDRHRPDLRWWLAEGLHTDTTLRAEIAAAHRLGFRGMEFLAMDEPGVDHTRYGWGSEEWAHDTQVVVEETTSRGMRVSFTSGANWSNANIPGITPEDDAAAQELDVTLEELAPGDRRTGELPRVDLTALGGHHMLPGEVGEVTAQRLVAVLAVRVLGRDEQELDAYSRHLGHEQPVILDAGSVLDLTDRVEDGTLDWTAPDAGPWRLLCYWQHGTGQTASPSASVNHTVTYLERAGAEAVIRYWDTQVLTPELREQIRRNPLPQMYMDSLELSTTGHGGLFWGRTVPAEFRARRGYDLIPHLPFLTGVMPFMACSIGYHHEPDAEHRELVEKVRRDWYQTLTDLYIENVLEPFGSWLREQGIGLRSEISYGAPFELSQPAVAVDGIETESLEFGSQIDAYRLLAGPAHLLGKEYSSETGATSRNHVLPHRFYDQIIATQLVAGVTRTVLHGWSSLAGAEDGTRWPGHEGMWPMFSERFDLRQPGSELYPLWTTALARMQGLLASGAARRDVLILRRDPLVDNTSGTAFLDEHGERILDEDFYAHHLMRDRRNLWWEDLGMQDAGWTYDFADGALLLREEVEIRQGEIQPDGPGYRAVIVHQEELDVEIAELLLGAARDGLRVLLVDGAREVLHLMRDRFRTHERAALRTSGLDGRDEELAAVVARLEEQPTVLRVSSPAGTLEALRALGVRARSPFTEPVPDMLTTLVEDGEQTVLLAYHHLYATERSSRARISFEGHGTVHRADVWTGLLRPAEDVVRDGDGTHGGLTLEPGETALIVLDRAAPGPARVPRAEVEELARLDRFALVVEDWDEGEAETIEEDRGLGYVSREVRIATRRTPLDAGEVELRPWSEIPGVGPEVSGVGTYRAAFLLDAAPAAGERIVLELGSTAGGLAAVSVNGGQEIGVDTSAPCADVTDLVRAGENEVVVRVTSALVNRRIARGYYDDVPDIVGQLNGGDHPFQVSVQEHGLLGPVRVLRRRIVDEGRTA